MATIEQHYEGVLSDAYAWMLGGMEAGIERNRRFFRDREITPSGSGLAVDLGAGCGFQSIPLADAGFSVTAVDLSGKLLDALAEYSEERDITCIRGDLMEFRAHTPKALELAVCMQDTVLHLESRSDVRRLFEGVAAALEPRGRLILTFRDLTHELVDLDRFIPVRSDETAILTCFLEYEAETVKVHDLLHRKANGGWELSKSYYRKLRLSPDWVHDALEAAGFASVDTDVDRGLVTVVARKT